MEAEQIEAVSNRREVWKDLLGTWWAVIGLVQGLIPIWALLAAKYPETDRRHPNYWLPDLPWWAWLICGLVSLLVMVLIRATATRRTLERRIQSVQAQAQDRSANFDLYVNQMAFEEPVDGVCTSYLLISAQNIGGGASILHHWRMYVQEPGQLEREVNIRQPAHGEDCSLVTDSSGHQALINESEFISQKAFIDAVEPGHAVRGFLRVDIPAGLSDGTRFILRVWDVRKRTYECEYDTRARRERASDVVALGNWPGVVIRHGRLTVVQSASSAQGEWIAVEAESWRWDNSAFLALNRSMAAAVTGTPRTERLVVGRLTITNRSPRVVSLTATIVVSEEGLEKPREGEVSPRRTDGFEPSFLDYPIKLDPGQTTSGPIAFDVPVRQGATVQTVLLKLRDRMSNDLRVVEVGVPGSYP